MDTHDPLTATIAVSTIAVGCIEIDVAALALLGELGFDPVYGARPLRRVIQQRMENPLAQRRVACEHEGGDRLRATTQGGAPVFARD